MMDLFTVQCSGWINCLSVENDRLTYNHYIAYKNQTATPAVYYSGPNTGARLLFPAGDDDDYFHNQVTIVVSNKANYTSSVVIYPITVSLFRCYMSIVYFDSY